MFNGKNTSGGIDAIPKIHVLFLTQKVSWDWKITQYKGTTISKEKQWNALVAIKHKPTFDGRNSLQIFKI